MIQPVLATKLQGTQNIQANKGVQNTQKTQAKSSVAAPQKQGATLGAMAANIQKANAKNGGIVNFKGTKEDLKTYLRYKVQSGDFNVEKGNYTRIVKTNDGTSYTVTIKGPEKRVKDYLKAPGVEKNATMEINNNVKKDDKYSLSINCHPEIYRKGTYFEKRYTEMKKKYGEI